MSQKRLSRLASVVLLVICLPGPAVAQDISDRIVAAFADWSAGHGIARSRIAVAYRGDLRGVGTVGDLAGPVDLASLSKAITAACMADLVMAERIGWDDPVHNHLPDVAAPLADVTVAQLVTHTGGLGPDSTQGAMETWRGPGAPVYGDVVAGIAARPLRSREMVYNNENYAVLGELIRAVSGRGYADTCAATTLGPAGVTTARPSPVYGRFAAWGGWRMTLADYTRLIWVRFGGADPTRFPDVDLGGGAHYGPGTVWRAFGDGFNFWHFGALCFEDGTGFLTFSVLWSNGWGARCLPRAVPGTIGSDRWIRRWSGRFFGEARRSAGANRLTLGGRGRSLARKTGQEPKMARTPPPFAPFEWMIAWRYLRARRAEGGVSVMTWISLIGITLAVFALIATLAVRSGFRSEFVGTILGANAHVTIYNAGEVTGQGRIDRTIADYDAMAARIAAVPGVIRAAPLVKGQVMASLRDRNAGVEVFGIRATDLATLPGIAGAERAQGDLARFGEGIAIGDGVARRLGVGIGDRIRLISPNGIKTAFGTSPRVNAYEVVYIFSVGRYDIDQTRVYMPFDEAQSYFNREGAADELEVMVDDPENVDLLTLPLIRAAGERAQIWTWRDSAGGFLRALEVEDNVMFIILSILVLIATMNIVSGLIMLVKNKGRDIGILRTIGLSEGSILRVFFICGAFTGIIGTALGVILGSLFAIYIDPIFSFVNYVMGGGVWEPSIRGIYQLPAELHLGDVLKAVGLSLGLSFLVTIFPARRAARLNPVEALRYE